MAPLSALLLTALVLRLTGHRGLTPTDSWAESTRFGLAVMFLLTGGAHFVGMRDDLVAMVPPSLPAPGVLVTVTGVLELMGAIGLLWRPTTRAAAVCLGLMLLAMFPANVYAATHDLQTEWLDGLVPRTVLQVVFLAATLIVARHDWSRRTLPAGPERVRV